MAAVARAAASAWVRGDMPRGFLATVSPRSCTLACGWMLFSSSVAHSSATVYQPEQNRTNRKKPTLPQPVPTIPRGPLIEGDGGRRKFHAYTSTHLVACQRATETLCNHSHHDISRGCGSSRGLGAITEL